MAYALAMPAKGRGEVLIVGDGDGAAEGQHGQRRVGANVVDRLRILAAGGGHGIGDAADAERAIDQGGDGAGGDVAGRPDADAVGGLNVVLPGGQRRSFDAVAEEDLGGAAGKVQRGEDLRRGRLIVEGGHLSPGDTVRPLPASELWLPVGVGAWM